jgi:acetyltransferase-like isoleucine patch superfamily enzyme
MRYRAHHLRPALLPNLLWSMAASFRPGIRREDVGSQLLGLPIFAHWKSKISIARGASLTFRDRGFLKLGMDYSGMHAQSPPASLVLKDRAQVVLHGNVDLHQGCLLWAQRDAKVEIGDNTFLSNGSKIISEEQIKIGSGCGISWDVTLLDTDFHHAVLFPGREPLQTRPIVIGDGVWIGCHVRVLKGTTIGDRSIVAAGAIVSGVFPPHSLIAGTPAQLIVTHVDWY